MGTPGFRVIISFEVGQNIFYSNMFSLAHIRIGERVRILSQILHWVLDFGKMALALSL